MGGMVKRAGPPECSANATLHPNPVPASRFRLERESMRGDKPPPDQHRYPLRVRNTRRRAYRMNPVQRTYRLTGTANWPAAIARAEGFAITR